MMPELWWGWARIDARGASAAGQRAAADALAHLDPALRLAHRGSQPVVPGFGISISHGRKLAVAVVGRVTTLGVDLCERDRGATIRRLASRYFTASERALLTDDRAATMAWAAKEAGLKALGLGLHDGSVFDDPTACPIRIGSLDPPRYTAPELLALHLEERDHVIIALAYSVQTAPSTSTVAPFM